MTDGFSVRDADSDPSRGPEHRAEVIPLKRRTRSALPQRSDLKALSDTDLLDRVRAGDVEAFGPLWSRHAQAATAAATSLGRSADVDDLVAEAYLRILTALQQGSGPSSAFRPYLYRTIASLVTTWGTRRREVASDGLDDIADPETEATAVEDHPVESFERGAAVTAFESLPEAWQSVLWYTEIEGLTPAKAAPHLGLSARAVAVKSSRARDHLRSAWVQAHLSTEGKPVECADAIERFDGLRREKLRPSTEARVRHHLDGCESCAGAYEEFRDLSSRLRIALFPLLFGGGVAAALLRDGVSAPAASAAGLVPGGGESAGATSAGLSGAGISAVAAAGVVVLTAAGLAVSGLLGAGTPTEAQANPSGTGAEISTDDDPPVTPTRTELPERTAPPQAREMESPAGPLLPSPLPRAEPRPVEPGDPAEPSVRPDPALPPTPVAPPTVPPTVIPPKPTVPPVVIPPKPLPAPPTLLAEQLSLSTDFGQLVYRGTGAVPNARIEIRGERPAIPGDAGEPGDPGMSPTVLATATVRADGSWEAPALRGVTPIGLTLSLRQVNPDAAALASPWLIHVEDQVFGVFVADPTGTLTHGSAPDHPRWVSWQAQGVPGATWGVNTARGGLITGTFDDAGNATVQVPLWSLLPQNFQGESVTASFGYSLSGALVEQVQLLVPDIGWDPGTPAGASDNT